METVSIPTAYVLKWMCDILIIRRISYLTSFYDNMQKLKQMKEALAAKESEIKTALRRSKNPRKEPTRKVLDWLDYVDSFKNDVGNIERELEENQRGFHNFRSRLKHGKRVFKMIHKVLELLYDSPFPPEILIDQPWDKALVFPTSSLVGESTAEKTLGEIWDSLVDPLNGKIGIYGMRGVGKTTIIKNINNRLAATSQFDKIIWATVSRDLSLERLQNEIAWQLNLDLSQCRGQEIRASRLHERLKQVNKILLVLDDVWGKIPLDEVGIPEPSRENNNSKIVLTTRSLEVCHLMETQKDIEVELLSEEEAWDLFVSRAGDQILISDIQPVARDVLHECGCLPLAIVTVGYSMREESDIRVWRIALNELRNSTTEIQGELFKHLKFSYTHLRNDTLRNCFSYCSLFPKDYKISPNLLIEYWMAEGLIPEVGDKVAEIDEGFAILKHLKDASMLEDGKGESIVMHDLIRNLVLDIGIGELGFLVKAGLGLEESPVDEGEWSHARKISLIGNKIEVLLEQPHCPNLSTLLLGGNPLSQNIPHSFFNQMHALQVLDLSGSNISLLPSSLSNLTKLRALFLTDCMNLGTLPSLGNLKELRVLNLSGTSIEELPQGMEELVNLRSLDLSWITELKNIQVGVIQKLTLLEDLRAHGSRLLWLNSAEVDSFIKEIGCLKRLATLTISVRCFANFNNAIRCIQWEVLKGSFQIYVEYFIHKVHTINEDNSVCISNVRMLNEGALLLPTNTQYLLIQGCTIPQLSKPRNLRLPKKCHLKDCNSMDCLVKGEEVEENALTNLEELKLSKIYHLEVLWKGVVLSGSFENLRILTIWHCHDLKILFVFKLLQHLKNIEYIHVDGCKLMEEIVGPNGEDHQDDATTTTIALPRLRALVLWDLPKLHTIISGKMLVCDSLVCVLVKGCRELKKLPFRVDSLSNLEAIGGESEWWEEVEWDDADTKTILQPRFTESEGFRESKILERLYKNYGYPEVR